METATAMIIPILFGSVAGTLITLYFTARRGRTQPIGYGVNMFGVFTFPDEWLFGSKLDITLTADREYQLDGLFFIEVAVINYSNRDYDSFPFGITIPDGFKAIDRNYESPDRHHCVEGEIQDVLLKPFNRGDRYKVQWTIVPAKETTFAASHPSGKQLIEMKDVKVSTTQTGVRFKSMPDRGVSQYYRDMYDLISGGLIGALGTSLTIHYIFDLPADDSLEILHLMLIVALLAVVAGHLDRRWRIGEAIYWWR